MSGMATPNSARFSTASGLSMLKDEVLSAWLFQEQAQRSWNSGREDEGVVLKKSAGLYTCFPPDLASCPDGFMNAVENMNVRVSIACSVARLHDHD